MKNATALQNIIAVAFFSFEITDDDLRRSSKRFVFKEI